MNQLRAPILMTSGRFQRLLPLLLLFAATSTGTLLASYPCNVYLAQKLTTVANSAQQRATVAHKHTKATLAAWKVWGDTYLAKHGHAYVPPKRKSPSLSNTDDATGKPFQIACGPPEITTIDQPVTTLIVPDDLFPPDAPLFTADLQTPVDLPPSPDTPDTPDSPQYPGFPGGPTIFPPAPGGTTPNSPTGPTPPVGPTGPTSPVPEPSSLLMLGTGLTALAMVRRNVLLLRKPTSHDSAAG